MSDSTNSSRPSTPETVIHRPKKAKTKILEYLKPTVYKPSGKSPKFSPPQDAQASQALLEALEQAGVRNQSTKTKQDALKKKYPAPRKLTVSIVNGKTRHVVHKYMPTRLLMAISPEANGVLECKPWAGKFYIYGKYAPDSMSAVLNAIILSQNMPVAATDIVENLYTYEACLRLSIPSTHPSLKPLLTCINDQLSTTDYGSEIIGFVTYRLGTDDPVFAHMTNVLCHKRFTGAVQDAEAFEKMIAKKPALQKAMMQIDHAHEARREAIHASKRAWRRPVDGGEKTTTAWNVDELLEEAAQKVGIAKQEEEVDAGQKETLLKLFKHEKKTGEAEKKEKAAVRDRTEKVG